jgi:hypothetical protein
VVIRKGVSSRFVGPTFKSAERQDLQRLAQATGTRVQPLGDVISGSVVRLSDPSGLAVAVAHVDDELAELPELAPQILNVGTAQPRVNITQRPPRAPAPVQRLGHVVLQTPHFVHTLNWYLDTFGMIVSDFQFPPGRRDLGPVMAFIRCDRGSVPADHHTLALVLGPAAGYAHSAYQVTDFGAIAAAVNTYWRRAITGRGASVATPSAAKSSTIGPIRTGSSSSTSPTATCSTTASNPAGSR